MQQKIENSGINVTLKDIANMKQYGKSDLKKKNDIESIVNFLKTKEGTSVVVVYILELVYLFYFNKHSMELL